MEKGAIGWKGDWSESRKRLAAWWKGKVLDRPAISLVAPRNRPIEDIPALEAPTDLYSRWILAEYRLNVAEREMASMHYLGEAFPYFDTHIGPGSLALFLGSEPIFADTTVWYQPCISDEDLSKPLEFDVENKWWRFQVKLVEEGVKHSRGRYLVSMPDLIEGLDILSSLRGKKQLLLDLRRRPDFVHEKLSEINEFYFQYFNEIHRIVSDDVGGNCFSAFRIWGPGRTAKLQCDFSAMISPAMFKEFAALYLAEQCQKLDYTVYHLDGTECVRHLDVLLSIPELRAIQWTPQSGRPGTGSSTWFEIYKRILSANKSLLLLDVEAHDVKPLLQNIGTKGVLISTTTRTIDEAQNLLGWSEQLG